MAEKTYVYEGKEVVLTGRVAQKPMRGGKRGTAGKMAELHEIMPKGSNPENKDFCKWVRITHMYEIIEKKDDTEN